MLEGVTYAYPSPSGDPVVAIESVSLTVGTGERLGIVGPNGGGKSTLLKVMLGELVPHAGRVKVCGLSPAEALGAGLVGSVAQRSGVERAFPITVRQLVEMPVARRIPWWSPSGRAVRDAASEAMSLTGIDGLADRPIRALSGGQFQRAMIARAIAPSPQVLVLDEPTVGIDAAGQDQFARMIERVSSGLGLTIVIVSHDLRAVAAGCDSVACLARSLHYHDAPEGLTADVLSEVFHHDLAPAALASEHDGHASCGNSQGGSHEGSHGGEP